MIFDSCVQDSPFIRSIDANRGTVTIIEFPSGIYVFKPYQSEPEKIIANIASELSIGPRQYVLHSDFIVEDFIDGYSFRRLPDDLNTVENMVLAGKYLGRILGILHNNGVLYNDVTLSDDCGNSHLIFSHDLSSACLIDYGLSVNLNNLTYNDYRNYVLKMPLAQPSFEVSEFVEDVVAQYMSVAESELGQSWSRIFHRDLAGLDMRCFKTRDHFLAFNGSFNKTYKYYLDA